MKCKNLFVEYFSTVCTSALLLRTNLMALLAERAWYTKFQSSLLFLGSLRYEDYGLRTTAGRALSFARSTGLSRANIER